MQQNSVDIEKWLRLIRSDGIGPVTFARLLKHFGSIDAALSASVKRLTEIEGIAEKTAETIARSRDKFNAKVELELAEKLTVHIIHLEDSRYPPVLKSIYDPPPLLYVKGSIEKSDNLAVSIVGSRRCSLYGQEQSSRFAHLLASAGFTIVSGMARGIDTAAHQGALAAGGRTIAVQGCGLAHIYPPENTKLYERIVQSGAVISELPLQFEPRSENFPTRNRIIAGLSLATIVIEAGLNSGALITAKAALENNREVMAVPGKIDSPMSRGSHLLIKQGAKLIESVEDVFEALGCIGEQLTGFAVEAARKAEEKLALPLIDIQQFKLSDGEKAVYDYLHKDPLHIEQIISDTGLHAGQISSALISLQLKGIVKQLPGSYFVRR
jgi:DNA processing protein